MATILIVAHAPLATSLQSVAAHAYAESDARVAAIDVGPADTLTEVEAKVLEALRAAAGDEVLVLTDAFGATPCNAALAAADGVQERVVTGVNVPMVWRALCYAKLPLGELVTRAVDGGRQGIMQVVAPRRQYQPNRPSHDDPDPHRDQ